MTLAGNSLHEDDTALAFADWIACNTDLVSHTGAVVTGVTWALFAHHALLAVVGPADLIRSR